MYFLDELKDMKLYRRQLLLPINEKDKRHGGLVFLLGTEPYQGLKAIQSDMIIPRYYRSYYTERAVMQYVKQEGAIDEDIDGTIITEELYDNSIILSDNCGMVLEDASNNTMLRKMLFQNRIRTSKELRAIYSKIKDDYPDIRYTYSTLDKYSGLNLFVDLGYYNNQFTKNCKLTAKRAVNMYLDLLNRILNDKRYESAGYNLQSVIIPVDEWVKISGDPATCHLVKTSINPISCIYWCILTKSVARLKAIFGTREVLFLGKSSCMKINFSKTDLTRSAEFLRYIRHIIDNRVVIDNGDDDTQVMVSNTPEPQVDTPTTDNKTNPTTQAPSNVPITPDTVTNINLQKSSRKAIRMQLIDSIEKSRNIKIDDISVDDDTPEEPAPKTVADKPVQAKATPQKTAKPKEPAKSTPTPSKKQETPVTPKDEKKKKEETIAKQKKELVKTIDKVAKTSTSVQNTLDNADNDQETSERLKKILSDLSTNPDDRGSDISGARASRLLKLQDDFLDSEFKDKKIRDIIQDTPKEEPIKPIDLNIDTVNPEWNNLTFASTIESYKLSDDIVKIFGCFFDKSNPLAVREISCVDASTTGNLIETYTVKYESGKGERFTIKVDIPKFVDNKYMVLRGNRKNIPIQLFLMPIIKTEESTVQIVSCYKKIFIRRENNTSGKSNAATDKLMKALRKEYKHIVVNTGDNRKVCSKYELPIDYIDLASNYATIVTPKYTFYFNQDQLRSKYKVDDSIGLPAGIDNRTKEVIYYSSNPSDPLFFSHWLYLMIETSLANTRDNERELFIKNYDSAATAVRYSYSNCSILGTKIPLVVICGLAIGLEPTLKRAHIKYKLTDTKPKYDPIVSDVIIFKDAYLEYKLDYASSLLMNGLKKCNTEDFSITRINSRLMFIEFLDMFGGRIKADGLDNFQDCMVDPITKEVLQHYKLPTDYVDILIHANYLLSDNKFTKHGNIRSSRRMRRQEQIASYMYDVLSSAYGAYSTGLKHGRKVGFSIKQSAIIDKVLIGNTTDDQSILNALGEYEAYFAVSPKGPSGMNSERAYSLDKRSFDDSMMNILSASTGFANTVGISRQATIDANIEGTRGYIYNDPSSNPDEINSVKTLCMTEAMTPFTSTRDDPMRLAMGFIQTSKHGMRCEKSDPLLITSGADEALPYLISNTFAHKASDDGRVEEIVPGDYMIIKKNHVVEGEEQYEYVDLSENVQKNSSSGFYVPLKLDTDLKVGSKVKKGEIVAYDKQSFSNEIGADDNIAYNIGTLSKFAILNTDEGFEDSAIISDDLSECMASDIILEKEIVVSKNANIYNIVKKGQAINEGDTLLIVQNAYEDEDLNSLLKNLSGEGESISELGRKSYTSKVTGVVQDIIVERTVELNELSPTLKKFVKEYEGNINSRRQIMQKYGISDSNKILQDTEALDPIGSLKNAAESVKIKIYLKYHDKFSVGCKLIYGTAVKGVAKDIFPKGEEPYSEYRKHEKIHALLSIGSINARMVTSVLVSTGMNKALIELSRKVKDMAGIKYDDNLI
jgi:hypothetical protein